MDMDPLARMMCAPAHPRSVPLVREHLREWLEDAGAGDELIDVAVLAASELVTNAVQASGSPRMRLGLTAVSDGHGLYLYVDGPGTGPTMANLEAGGAGPTATHGRGLALLRSIGADLACGPAASHFVCTGSECHGPGDLAVAADVRHVVSCHFSGAASLALVSDT
ncbi:MAG: ATP-binding protein [Acidimicrobiia bacterium]|nr:ATP-binding protein [Acidimicrobiia bacterium]